VAGEEKRIRGRSDHELSPTGGFTGLYQEVDDGRIEEGRKVPELVQARGWYRI